MTTANPGATNGIHQGRPYALSGDLGSLPHVPLSTSLNLLTKIPTLNETSQEQFFAVNTLPLDPVNISADKFLPVDARDYA